MRIPVVLIYFFISVFTVAFPLSGSYAQKAGGAGRDGVLSTSYKVAPGSAKSASGQSVSARRPVAVRLTGQPKTRPVQAAVASSDADKARWAALPLSRKLSAQSAIVMDSVTGKVIYAQSPDRGRQPASTIKVLTGMLAIEELRNNEKISPSRRAAAMPRSKIYLSPRKTYVANDLINAVLLASANDASVALAEKVAGSERDFAAMMTARARSLGARNTICKTATGLTSRGQQSTARDLAIIFNNAMNGSEFARRVGRSKVKTGFGKLLWNHNKALWEVDGAEGGKTGYTKAARQTYVGKFKREQGELVIALMGSETMWDDVKNLVEYGFAQMQSRRDALSPVASAEDVPARIASLRRLYQGGSQRNGLRILVADQVDSSL